MPLTPVENNFHVCSGKIYIKVHENDSLSFERNLLTKQCYRLHIDLLIELFPNSTSNLKDFFKKDLFFSHSDDFWRLEGKPFDKSWECSTECQGKFNCGKNPSKLNLIVVAPFFSDEQIELTKKSIEGKQIKWDTQADGHKHFPPRTFAQEVSIVEQQPMEKKRKITIIDC